MIPSRVKDITGERFGEWDVVGYSHTKRSGRSWPAMWICRCSTCGAERAFRGGDLRRRAPRCSKCFEAKYDIAGRLSAGHRGFEFDITPEYGLELLERQGYRCALSGMEIRLARSVRRHQYRAETTASIDRIDSSLGYVRGNVQWVHKDVNRMKWVL